MFDSNGVERCDEFCTHGEVIDKVQADMPDEEKLYDLAELFKMFGDSTRIRILYVLFEAEMCVCDIAAALGMTKSAVSHQLKVLRQNRLVKYSKVGKNVFYELSDDHVRDIIEKALEHIEE
jgi:ArsR family transcriptional regulator